MKTKTFWGRIGKKTGIKIENRTVEIGFWDHTQRQTLTGKFPVDESIIPEDEVFFALVHVTDDEEKNIIAVHQVYPDAYEGFRIARLMGDPQIIPAIGDYLDPVVKDFFHLLPFPLKSFRINVVLHESEKLFETGGLMFDRLNGQEKFERGRLSVFRNGELFDQTSSIRYAGGMGFITCFDGLDKIYHDGRTSALDAHELETGDYLILEVPVPPQFNLADDIRENAWFSSAVIQAMEGKGEMTLKEVKKSFAKKAAEIGPDFNGTQIVRFCPKPQ